MDQEIKLRLLFLPIKVGKVELKNRIIMAPMVTSMGKTDGFITEKEKNYFLRRAIGGPALITLGDITVVPNSQATAGYDGIWHDKFIPSWRDFAKSIHHAGAKLSLQLCHGGSQCVPRITGEQPLAPSEFISPFTKQATKALSIEEIEELVEKFAEAAVRARNAGVDIVEIQGAQGFLVHNFMTPLFNKRDDAYGGDVRGRMKFPLEILKRVKEKAGNDYPVVFRMVASDLMEGGITPNDSKKMALMLDEGGADALHFTAGAGFHVMPFCIPPVDAGLGCIADLVSEIKKGIRAPAIVAQRIIDPLQAEEILKDGKADVISLGRALICDPDWAKKADDYRLEDIRKCIGCCQGCFDHTLDGKSHITCLLNPEVGKEKEYEINPADEIKKVDIIGGGLAGLEAAKTAALRGHEVTLYERNNELGGQWISASMPPKKQGYRGVTKYYIRQLEQLNVKIILNKDVTPTLIKNHNPDVVVVATGAVPVVSEIPGADRKNVVAAQDVLCGKVNVVHDKVAIIGGGLVGCETADFLADQGKQITIIEMLRKVAADVGPLRKHFLMQRLANGGVKMLTSSRVEEIAEQGIITIDENGQRKNIGIYDIIVLALGSKSENKIASHIEDTVSKVFVIGDALRPRMALDAIAEGAAVGREI